MSSSYAWVRNGGGGRPRGLALLVALLAAALLVGTTGLTQSAGAVVSLPGANAGAWPTTWKQYTYADGSRISDLNDDINPASLDMTSGTCAACAGPASSVAYASDGTNVFFRMRMAVDNNDATKGGLAQGTFLVQIANPAGVVKAVVGVDGKDQTSDTVYVANAVGGTVTDVYGYPFTAGSPSSAAMRWIPVGDGTGQYFLDFQVPLSAIQTASGGAVTPTTGVRLYYGSSAAANLATINKDFMLGNVITADFSTVKTIKFFPSIFPVTFDSNGGSAVASQSVEDDSPATAPTDPTRAGYAFDGWWTAASGGTAWSFATPITGATTLYAHWKQIWTLDFDSNGGSAVASQSVIDGQPAVAPADPTRTGYAFDGWWTAASGGTAWSFSSPVSGATTLFAHWKLLYTVTFDSDGGSAVAAQVVKSGDSATAPAAPTRVGYDFAGWYDGGSAYDFSTPVSGAFTLTAHWAKQVYTVTFDSGGGSAVDDQSIAYGDSATQPETPTRTGYDFTGWFVNGESYDFGSPVSGALALTAHWVKHVYTISFDSDGGSQVDDEAVSYGDSATQPDAPVRQGYDFAGWFLGSDEYDFSTPVSGAFTLTAHWVKQVYTVSFDAGGGSAVADQSVAYGDSATQPAAPTRVGYDFTGWYAGGSAYDFSSPVSGALTLTAHWVKQVYTVSFDAGGGSAVGNQSVAYGDSATQPALPTRVGYDFTGWYAGGSAYDFGSPVSGALTLTAHWSKHVYAVSFDSDGGSQVATQSVAYQDHAAAPAAPTKAGFTFLGWYAAATGGSAYDFGTAVDHDLVLHARWTPVTPPVTTPTDSDGDGVTDADELAGTGSPYHCATNPQLADTDHDGLTDGKEIHGVKMKVSVVTKKGTHRLGRIKTNPCSADTDHDGLKDRREERGSKARHTTKVYRSNPLKKDSDRDGLKDKVEITGSANVKHGHRGSNPLNWDTDHGGVSDLGEIRAGSDPTIFASGPVNPRTGLGGSW
jgi:uncharacterized repeat protein (TIGR02543 family)